MKEFTFTILGKRKDCINHTYTKRIYKCTIKWNPKKIDNNTYVSK